MMFLAVIEKELWLSLCAYTWRWDLSLRRLCTTQSPHFFVGICHSLFIACVFGLFTSNLQRQFLHFAACGFHESWGGLYSFNPYFRALGRSRSLGIPENEKPSRAISQGFDAHILLDFIGYQKIWTSIKYGASLFWTPKWLMHHGPVLHHANGEWSTSNWGADSCG